MRTCSRCGVSEEYEMLGNSSCGGKLILVCQECDGDLEREWVSEDPENRKHYLDTFSPYE